MCAPFALQKNQPLIAFLYTMKSRKFASAAVLFAQTRSKKTHHSTLIDLPEKQILRGCFRTPIFLAVVSIWTLKLHYSQMVGVLTDMSHISGWPLQQSLTR